jgi:hypothetical protein
MSYKWKIFDLLWVNNIYNSSVNKKSISIIDNNFKNERTLMWTRTQFCGNSLKGMGRMHWCIDGPESINNSYVFHVVSTNGMINYTNNTNYATTTIYWKCQSVSLVSQQIISSNVYLAETCHNAVPGRYTCFEKDKYHLILLKTFVIVHSFYSIKQRLEMHYKSFWNNKRFLANSTHKYLLW